MVFLLLTFLFRTLNFIYSLIIRLIESVRQTLNLRNGPKYASFLYMLQYFRGQSEKGDISMKDSELERTGMFNLLLINSIRRV